MKINIVNSQVLRLVITDSDQVEICGDALEGESLPQGRVSFTTKVDFESDQFYVTFNLTLRTGEDKLINVLFRSMFSTDSSIDESFKSGDFPYVNAPAIAYPFLRAFISNLTLNSGYSPVMLPSINFVAMKDRVIRPEN